MKGPSEGLLIKQKWCAVKGIEKTSSAYPCLLENIHSISILFTQCNLWYFTG